MRVTGVQTCALPISSLAWVWEQLALDKVRWINDPDGSGDVLAPINKVDALPKAPEIPTVVTQ